EITVAEDQKQEARPRNGQRESVDAKPGADLLRVGRAAQQRGGDPFESVANKQDDHPHKMKEDCDGKACHSGHSVKWTRSRIRPQILPFGARRLARKTSHSLKVTVEGCWGTRFLFP